MDDDMEDEIIREVAYVHLHLLWKYIGITSSKIAELVLPGPGESLKSKLLQPGPFMILTFLIIITSIILQSRNNWLQKAILSCHKTISLTVVADHGLKSFVAASIGSDNVTQELTDGIAGVYALQGRRGTMEDRFCVMQHVDVGGSNQLSFFGVYDGHGGQFVAEYVKQNLFINTVEKIRQLKMLTTKNKGENKNGMTVNNNNNNNEAINKQKNNGSFNSSKKSSEISEKFLSVPTDLNLNTLNDKKEQNESETEIKKGKKSNNVKEDTRNNENKENFEVKNGSKLEEVKEIKPEETTQVEESLKKEDPYSNVKLKKRNSFGNTKELLNAKETEKITETYDNTYIDLNRNINYTKLLTDQIMDIDKKVVDRCKSKTDFSGTTAVIAVLDGELLIIGNVGDSRAVMGDMKGSTIPLSFDHKPNQLKERRRIKEAGGFITFTGVWRVAGILATSRALGDFPLKDPRKLITAEPDVLTFSLKDHKAHFVVLATDGLWDVVTNEEAVAFVRDHIHENDFGARSLVLHAYNKGSQDNITVTILNFSRLVL